MSTIIDLTGQRFGRLVVRRLAGRIPGRRTLWRCECDCGANIIVPTSVLRRGGTASCGCPCLPAEPARERRGKLPYGYRWTETGVSIDTDAAARIRAIDALDREKLTRKAIADEMNDSYPRPDGRLRNVHSVDLILTNRHLYRGAQRGKHTDTWPVILEPQAHWSEVPA